TSWYSTVRPPSQSTPRSHPGGSAARPTIEETGNRTLGITATFQGGVRKSRCPERSQRPSPLPSVSGLSNAHCPSGNLMYFASMKPIVPKIVSQLVGSHVESTSTPCERASPALTTVVLTLFGGSVSTWRSVTSMRKSARLTTAVPPRRRIFVPSSHDVLFSGSYCSDGVALRNACSLNPPALKPLTQLA